MTENQDSRNFDTIKDNPEILLLYIDKYVKVQMIKNRCFKGFLHSVDPISLSILLLIPYEKNYKVTLIPGNAVQEIQEETHSSDIISPTRKRKIEPTQSDVVQRKAQLMSWFNKNLLPVKDTGDNLTIGNVSVLPPYNVTDICAQSPVVFMQFRKLIESMPQDFEI